MDRAKSLSLKWSLVPFVIFVLSYATFNRKFWDLRIRLGCKCLQGSSHLIFTVVVTKVVVKATVSDFKSDPSLRSAGCTLGPYIYCLFMF